MMPVCRSMLLSGVLPYNGFREEKFDGSTGYLKNSIPISYWQKKRAHLLE